MVKEQRCYGKTVFENSNKFFSNKITLAADESLGRNRLLCFQPFTVIFMVAIRKQKLVSEQYCNSDPKTL